MKVEIVIPCINLWNKYTKQCVNSAMDAMMRAKAHDIDAHLILIDNASTDETKIEAPKMNSELFLYHRNEERWGFQKSVNFGVKYGIEHGADFIMVCNNDIILHPEALWRLVERFNKNPVGMVSCMDVAGELKEKNITPQMIGALNANDKEVVDEAPHPHFSAFMVSKECWETVGEFDEVFFPAYFEDNDYHYRMNLMEVPAIVLPTAMFYHYGSRTQNEANENGQPIVVSMLFENNRAFYVKKWGGLPGQENFTRPYNNPEWTLKATKQIGVDK
jgi:GT2 family glycosyltransferase